MKGLRNIPGLLANVSKLLTRRSSWTRPLVIIFHGILLKGLLPAADRAEPNIIHGSPEPFKTVFDA